jgi:RNA polymerase sigma-70 factor (ECF subfamily)
VIRADALADGAWREIAGALRSYIGRRVPDAADRDDLVQDVLLRAHRGRGHLKDRAAPGPWIYGIANNAVIDYWRRNGRRGRASIALAETDLAELPELPDDDRLQQVLAGFVANQVARLPSPYRETLTLTELQGMRQADAAAMLGISLAALKSRVLRGRVLVRQALLECCALEFGPTGRVVDCMPQPGKPRAATCRDCSPA